jgi:hypothetical protein
MSEFITVINGVNRVATVHLATCSMLGRDPTKSTNSAERIVSNDRLSALIAAREGMPQNFGFCSFCQREIQAVLQTLRAD